MKRKALILAVADMVLVATMLIGCGSNDNTQPVQVEIEQIAPHDGDVAKAALLARIPHDLVNARAGLELLPLHRAVGLAETDLLEDARKHL